LRKKPAPQSLREASGKKSGGQVGHVGAALKFRETADYTVHHYPETCGCGADLSQVMSAFAPEKRQVFDIPQPKIEVTEHHLHRKICPCCQVVSKAAAPASAPAPLNYGDTIKGRCCITPLCCSIFASSMIAMSFHWNIVRAMRLVSRSVAYRGW
jgi:hypothetical protein